MITDSRMYNAQCEFQLRSDVDNFIIVLAISLYINQVVKNLDVFYYQDFVFVYAKCLLRLQLNPNFDLYNSFWTIIINKIKQ